MENYTEKTLTLPLLFSLFFHFLLFYFSSNFNFFKPIKLTPLPMMEVLRISLPGETLAPVVVEKKKVSLPKEEITLPEKKLTKPAKIEKKEEAKKEEIKKEEVKKEEPDQEKKVLTPSPIPAVAKVPLAPGGGLSLEGAKFPYTYYLSLLRERISKNWRWGEAEEEKRKTVVYFRIFRDGHLNEIKMKQSSGDETFDLLARRAIELSFPLPPLPAGYPDEYLGVYFEFALQ